MDTASSIGVLILATLAFANFITILNYWCDTVPKLDEIHARTVLGNQWYENNIVYKKAKAPIIIEAEVIKSGPIVTEPSLTTEAAIAVATVTNGAQIFKGNSRKKDKVIFLPSPESYEEFVDDRPPWEE